MCSFVHEFFQNNFAILPTILLTILLISKCIMEINNLVIKNENKYNIRK